MSGIDLNTLRPQLSNISKSKSQSSKRIEHKTYKDVLTVGLTNLKTKHSRGVLTDRPNGLIMKSTVRKIDRPEFKHSRSIKENVLEQERRTPNAQLALQSGGT